MQEIVCPPEFMIAQMIDAGVDHCILQAGGGYGAMNDYNAFAQSRIRRIHRPAAHRRGDRGPRRGAGRGRPRAPTLGLKGLYYSHDFSRHGYARNVDHDASAPFWDKIVGCGCRCSSSCPRRRTTTARATSATCWRSTACCSAIPRMRFVLRDGPAGRAFRAAAANGIFPPEVLAAYKRDNLLIEIMFPITWGGVWDYPYPEAQALIRAACATCSAPASWSGARTCRTSSGSAPTGNRSTMCASTALPERRREGRRARRQCGASCSVCAND